MALQSLITLFIILLIAFLVWRNRKKIEVQKIFFPFIYFVLYRAKWGLRLMDRVGGRYRKFWNVVFTAGIIIGFIAMVWICYELVSITLKLLFEPSAGPGIMPVLPVDLKVVRVVTVPFLYWIISIFVIALVHEFSHGIASRHIGVKVKSSGLAALCLLVPVIPAAFVEPDEKRILKMPMWQQMKVFAAGPLANIVTAVVAIAFVGLVLTPVLDPVLVESGIQVSRLSYGGPAEVAGIQVGDIITSINGAPIESISNFSRVMNSTVPGAAMVVGTNRGDIKTVLGDSPDSDNGYLGIYPKQDYVAAGWLPQSAVPAVQWILGLLYWLFFLNIGIGVFNLLPIGPLDGGRMMHALCKKYNAYRVYKVISTFFFALVLVNIFAGFIH